MTLTSQVLQRIEAALPLDGLAWDDRSSTSSWPEAAVLVAITDEPHTRVLLGRRSRHLPLHPGEVAFPGGKREDEDASPWVTAKREAHEEVGLEPRAVHPLGELPPLVTRTGFEVHPCIGKVPADSQWQPDPREFDSVFQLSLETFADPALFRLEEMGDGEHRRMVPHYRVAGDNIWGVTAAVLALLANVAYDAGLDLQRDWKVMP